MSITASGVYFAGMHESLDDFYFELINKDTKTRDLYRVFEVGDALIEDLEAIFQFAPLSIAVMEDYGPINRFAGKVTQRAEICGRVKHHILTKLGVPLITISPTSLKKHATGGGRAEKDAMKVAAHEQFGLHVKSDNVADACHLAHFGYSLLSGVKPKCEFQRFNP